VERPTSPRGDLPSREPAAALPPDTRALAETLAERLELAVGRCRLECELQDGRLVAIWRHQRIIGDALDEL
jgi:hypothetical protein